MERTLAPHLRRDLPRKIILLSGPRQSGKTTVAKMLEPDHEYVNYDDAEHRTTLIDRSWDRGKKLLILDELHKMPRWKGWLKGLYDTEGLRPPIIVTGSARLETYRKVGDSLAGRYFPFRLHPLDLKEVHQALGAAAMPEALDRLLRLGGFPEPFLDGTEVFYNRWRRTHLDIILRHDLIELAEVQHIVQVETLIELLRSRVGSPISHASLARDLGCSDKTVKGWLLLLENMYVIFKVPPFHRNVARSLLKAPKYYFFDCARVKGDEGARFENLVAAALLKEVHLRVDTLGEDLHLRYLRTKDGRAVDFVLEQDGKARLLIEAKWSDEGVSPPLRYFAAQLPEARAVQVVAKLRREKTYPDRVEVRQASSWLAAMPL